MSKTILSVCVKPEDVFGLLFTRTKNKNFYAYFTSKEIYDLAYSVGVIRSDDEDYVYCANSMLSKPKTKVDIYYRVYKLIEDENLNIDEIHLYGDIMHISDIDINSANPCYIKLLIDECCAYTTKEYISGKVEKYFQIKHSNIKILDMIHRLLLTSEMVDTPDMLNGEYVVSINTNSKTYGVIETNYKELSERVNAEDKLETDKFENIAKFDSLPRRKAIEMVDKVLYDLEDDAKQNILKRYYDTTIDEAKKTYIADRLSTIDVDLKTYEFQVKNRHILESTLMMSLMLVGKAINKAPKIMYPLDDISIVELYTYFDYIDKIESIKKFSMCEDPEHYLNENEWGCGCGQCQGCNKVQKSYYEYYRFKCIIN